MSKYEIIEPDKHFLIKLTDRWYDIGGYLYANTMHVSPTNTVRKAIMTFISGLPNKEKATIFKDVYEVLEKNMVGKKEMFNTSKTKYFKDYIEVYGFITDYLGETYFKSYRVATPKYKGTKHLELPKSTKNK